MGCAALAAPCSLTHSRLMPALCADALATGVVENTEEPEARTLCRRGEHLKHVVVQDTAGSGADRMEVNAVKQVCMCPVAIAARLVAVTKAQGKLYTGCLDQASCTGQAGWVRLERGCDHPLSAEKRLHPHPAVPQPWDPMGNCALSDRRDRTAGSV